MSAQFSFQLTSLQGLIVISRLPVADSRGYLERLFCAEALSEIGISKPVIQINHTLTHRPGAVRGMHFQRPPHAEVKIISCLKGEVFDVAIDLRARSATFLCWHGEILSPKNHKSLYIPEGFAHGFQAITDDCELLYVHTEAYAPHAEGGIVPTDPRVAIRWPLPITELSDRDNNHPLLDGAFSGIVI